MKENTHQMLLANKLLASDKMALNGSKNDVFLQTSSLIGLSHMKHSIFWYIQKQDVTSQPHPLLAMVK